MIRFTRKYSSPFRRLDACGWKQQGYTFVPISSSCPRYGCYTEWFLKTGSWKHERRTSEEWTSWAQHGAKSKAVLQHRDPELRKNVGH